MKKFWQRYWGYFVYILLGLTYIFLLPIWQGADEAAYFRYGQFIAQENSIYTKEYLGKEAIFYDEEIEKSHLENQTYLIMANANYHYSEQFGVDYIPKNKFLTTAFNYPPLYFGFEAMIIKLTDNFLSVEGQYNLIKILGLFISLIWLFFTQKIFKIFFSKNYRLLSFLVFLYPMWVYQNTIINASLFLNLLAIITFYYLLKIREEKGQNKKTYWILGILLGLGIISKGQYLIFLPVGFFVWLSLFWQSNIKKEIFKKGIITFVIMMLVGGWWYLKNWLDFGQLLSPDCPTMYENGKIVRVIDLSVFEIIQKLVIERYQTVMATFVAHFGWADTMINNLNIYYFYAGILWLGMISFLYGENTKKFIKKGGWIFLLTLLILELGFTKMNLNNILNSGYSEFPKVARYYFSVFVPIFFLILIGYQNLLRKYFKYGMYCLLISFLVLHLFSLQTLANRFYGQEFLYQDGVQIPFKYFTTAERRYNNSLEGLKFLKIETKEKIVQSFRAIRDNLAGVDLIFNPGYKNINLDYDDFYQKEGGELVEKKVDYSNFKINVWLLDEDKNILEKNYFLRKDLKILNLPQRIKFKNNYQNSQKKKFYLVIFSEEMIKKDTPKIPYTNDDFYKEGNLQVCSDVDYKECEEIKWDLNFSEFYKR